MKKHTYTLFIIVLFLMISFGVRAQTPVEGKYFTSFDSTKIYYEVKGMVFGYPDPWVFWYRAGMENLCRL